MRLTGDGVAKIGDLDLAVAIDRFRLTTDEMMVGPGSYPKWLRRTPAGDG